MKPARIITVRSRAVKEGREEGGMKDGGREGTRAGGKEERQIRGLVDQRLGGSG
jgi:hypothetical protein